MVLRCQELKVFQALANSQKFKPNLLGQLAPDILLVDSGQVKARKKQLVWIGLIVSDEFIVSR